MLYMFQLRYRPENADDLRRHFEHRGVTGHGEGVFLRGAWVSRTRNAMALVEVRETDQIDTIRLELSQFGDLSFEPVVDINQIM
jgi:hypothetical protein